MGFFLKPESSGGRAVLAESLDAKLGADVVNHEIFDVSGF